MTIKELEQLSGLTRSNIRFYEEKGLIVSKVLENGYHDYSMDNLNDLKAIKLLRSLGISIEEISKIKMNQLSLVESVEKNMNHLSAEKQQADHSLQISQKIIEENYSFADLGQNDIFVIETPKELEQDTLVIPNPWIRFFAREIDGWLCGIVLMAILHYVFLSSLTYRNTIMTAIAGAIIQLVLEPFFIAYLSTTPGKWAFGIYVYGFDHKNYRFCRQ